ncbi:hypothetical protein [Ewingella americana]|uniref:Uncharacterized protein n=1 Tax=Ewingella americana TaxID=41202 RepID=A0A502G3Q6_9GAMM|nr:hypothetical protein [Ewingella americana]TPG55846.1 hypothetical protein EAH77_23005 [Ewingella americana]
MFFDRSKTLTEEICQNKVSMLAIIRVVQDERSQFNHSKNPCGYEGTDSNQNNPAENAYLSDP